MFWEVYELALLCFLKKILKRGENILIVFSGYLKLPFVQENCISDGVKNSTITVFNIFALNWSLKRVHTKWYGKWLHAEGISFPANLHIRNLRKNLDGQVSAPGWNARRNHPRGDYKVKVTGTRSKMITETLQGLTGKSALDAFMHTLILSGGSDMRERRQIRTGLIWSIRLPAMERTAVKKYSFLMMTVKSCLKQNWDWKRKYTGQSPILLL